MPGRHASADRSRFRRDLSRLILLALLTVVVAVGVVMSLRLLVGGSEEPDPAQIAVGDPDSTSTSPPSTGATTTVATRPSTTSSFATSTAPSIPTTTRETTTTLPPVRGPEQLTVLVLNSTRIAGLAGRLTERLSEQGYRTIDPDNHPTQLETSVVWYTEGFDREAEVLAEEIPDANIELFPGEDPRTPLTVVLGSSYRE